MVDVRETRDPPLAAVRDDAFARLAAARGDRASPYRTPALATIDADGRPQARTVVVRAFDPRVRRLEIHTDARSAKVSQIERQPWVELHVWDAEAEVQLRLCGQARLRRDADAADAWATQPGKTQATYGIAPSPGTRLPTADAYTGAKDADVPTGDDARRNFAVITVEVEGLDWLCLSGDKHRRAVFRWRGGEEEASWIVP